MPSPTGLFDESDQRTTFDSPAELEDSQSYGSLNRKKKKRFKAQKHAAAVAAEPDQLADEEDHQPIHASLTATYLQAKSDPGTPEVEEHPVQIEEETVEEHPVQIEEETTALKDDEALQTTIPSTSDEIKPLPPGPRGPAAVANSPPIRTLNLSRRPIGGSAPPFPISKPRRESIATSHPSFFDPPPPHMPQPHYFTVPDLGLNLNLEQDPGRIAGSGGYVCSLDSFADAGDEVAARKARDALLVGFEGGLEVYRILPNKLEVVGRLEGLEGSIIEAKILPWTAGTGSPYGSPPLVALIIHGPLGAVELQDVRIDDSISYYQTTVEIYSLQTQRHIATLFRCVPQPIRISPIVQTISSPEPTGHLSLAAEGRHIVVASAESGEVWVFSQSPEPSPESFQYRCIGKFWTSLQNPSPNTPSRSPVPPDGIIESTDYKETSRVALYSLGPRWLVLVPPSISSTISIQGLPLFSERHPTPLGAGSHASPSQPLVTCEVVGSDIESAWTRLGRQAAQGLVKYSQKGIEIGLQGWKELTQPSQPTGPKPQDRTFNKDDVFPPTKGPSEDPNRLAREPALVSVIDLDTLDRVDDQTLKHPPLPVATFALNEGCNFLSLSATGTKLLTANRKGEATMVWDLSQIAHGKSQHGLNISEDIPSGPCVTQVQRIARNSSSVIVDCAWSRDDDAVALLTAHGTVHLHEMLPRRTPAKLKPKATIIGSASEKADATVGLSTGTSPPSSSYGFISTIRSGWQTVSTQVNSIRTTNSTSALGLATTFAGLREVTASAGNAGSRAVARGLSQGFTAAKGGASDYWHADDNKIRHKALQDPASSKSIRWIRRQSSTSLAIVCGGTVHVHPVQYVTRRKGDDIITGLRHEKSSQKTYALPPITTRGDLSTRKVDVCTGQGPHGFWILRHSSPPHLSQDRRDTSTGKRDLSEPAHEVESNPPYCPFHADPRIDIFAFDDTDSGGFGGDFTTAYDTFRFNGHGLPDEEPWTFGGALPPSVKINENSFHEGDVLDEEDGEGFAGQAESRFMVRPTQNDGGETQIRINTRRKMPAPVFKTPGPPKVDEDFELLEDEDDPA